MTTVVYKQGSGCFAQVLWFLLVGWWASQIWLLVAYFFMLTIIGIPVGILMMNYLPKIVALRETEQIMVYDVKNGQATKIAAEQLEFWKRAVYFLLIGWWLTFILVELAWVISLTLIGIPIAIAMYDFAPTALTLQKFSK